MHGYMEFNYRIHLLDARITGRKWGGGAETVGTDCLEFVLSMRDALRISGHLTPRFHAHPEPNPVMGHDMCAGGVQTSKQCGMSTSQGLDIILTPAFDITKDPRRQCNHYNDLHCMDHIKNSRCLVGCSRL
jgi:hypothetical protein